MSNPEFTAPDYTSQDASTYKANIDASIAANGADCVNLAFSYASGTGTFTVHDAQGGALSASNPAFVRFQDKDNPGYYKYISVEANQNFIDDNGSSEIINNLFGATTGVAWAQDVPFYLYAVADDTMASVQMMISRIPHRTTAPAVGEIGAPDDAVADNSYSFWSFDNIDETLYDGNPCVCLGSFRMQMSASDDWTVQTLSTADGIGRFHEDTLFTFPAGQNGAAASTYVQSNAGTEPTFGTNSVYYRVLKNGYCYVTYEFLNVNNTPSGANTVQFTMPIEYSSNQTRAPVNVLFVDNSDSDKNYNLIPVFTTAGGVDVSIRQDASTSYYTNATLATNDDIIITGMYNIAAS